MLKQDSSPQTVLVIETYRSGSHGRILDLLKLHSALHIEEIGAEREHWRWLAIAAHYDIIEQIKERQDDPPELILLSGPLNVGALVAMLPESWARIPRVVYLHESQWTYPSEEYDQRPYLLGHLDAIRLCNRAWFNSHYHLTTFWEHATSPNVGTRLRRLAARLQPELRPRCYVVYPPVSIDIATHTDPRLTDAQRILWNARWELDKRPDRFVQMLDALTTSGHQFDVMILGSGGKEIEDILADIGPHASRARVTGHFDDRASYERAVASSDIVVSTAEHEFFGVAVLEAALAGVTPVLPDALAYPETLPAAYFYRPGDMSDLARIVGHLLQYPVPTRTAVRSDASRFLPGRTVADFDARIRSLIESSQG